MGDKLAELNARLQDQAAPRALLALGMREAGAKWAEIGRALGVTTQRAHQLAKQGRRYRATA